jgi:hypothetical protein
MPIIESNSPLLVLVAGHHFNAQGIGSQRGPTWFPEMTGPVHGP